MANKDKRIIIIGAGVAGLVAAIELEKKGFSPLIIDKSNRVGGRLKTDLIENTPLDHGFQVYLTAYDIPKKFLNINKLELIEFLPGSLILNKNGNIQFGDPSRNFSFFSSLFSSISTFSDKLKTLRLSNKLKSMSTDEIFRMEDISTIDFLKKYGFSEKYISNFFLPFFTGIFLEDKLKTSSNKFCFIFKMFAEGNAAVPKRGIEEIPKQLVSKLNKSEFIFNTKITAINGNTLIDSNSNEYDFDKLIIATSMNLKNYIHWHDCYNIYFKVNKSTIKKKLIGLIPGNTTLINNFHFLDDLYDLNTNIISTTIVNSKGLTEENLIDKVKIELEEVLGLKNPSLVKFYYISQALPDIKNSNDQDISKIKVKENIYQAGDHTLTGTLNHAFKSGLFAAELLIKELKN